MSKKLTLGIQSPEGQKRVSILGSAKLEELYKEVQKAFGLPSATFLLSQDQRKELKIENSTTELNIENSTTELLGLKLLIEQNKLRKMKKMLL